MYSTITFDSIFFPLFVFPNDPPQTSILIDFYMLKADLMYLTAEVIFTSQTKITNTLDSFVI